MQKLTYAHLQSQSGFNIQDSQDLFFLVSSGGWQVALPSYMVVAKGTKPLPSGQRRKAPSDSTTVQPPGLRDSHATFAQHNQPNIQISAVVLPLDELRVPTKTQPNTHFEPAPARQAWQVQSQYPAPCGCSREPHAPGMIVWWSAQGRPKLSLPEQIAQARAKLNLLFAAKMDVPIPAAEARTGNPMLRNGWLPFVGPLKRKP